LNVVSPCFVTLWTLVGLAIVKLVSNYEMVWLKISDVGSKLHVGAINRKLSREEVSCKICGRDLRLLLKCVLKNIVNVLTVD
jgi:hypothetical protein